RAPGGVLDAADQPALESIVLALRDRRGARVVDSTGGLPGRQRTDGYQVGAELCVAVAGGHHRGGNRLQTALPAAISPAGARLLANAAIRSRAGAAAGLPLAGKRDRSAAADGGRALGSHCAQPLEIVAVSLRPGARLSRLEFAGIRRRTVCSCLSLVRCAG